MGQLDKKSFKMKIIFCLLVSLVVIHGRKIDAHGKMSRMPAGKNADVRANSQSLTCYDYSNGGGDSVNAIDYIPALRNYNMDNRIGSCCFTGILMFQHNLTTRRPVSDSQVLRMIGSTTLSTFTSMITSSAMRSSPTTTCHS